MVCIGYKGPAYSSCATLHNKLLWQLSILVSSASALFAFELVVGIWLQVLLCCCWWLLDENHFIGPGKYAISSISLPVLNCPHLYMCRCCKQFNHNVRQCRIRAGKWLDFIDTTPGTNLNMFAALYPINVSILEYILSSHPDQVFVKYVCSGLRNGFELGYFGPKKCKISHNLVSANENLVLVRDYPSNEMKCWRILGPFVIHPAPFFQCRPIDIAPNRNPGNFGSSRIFLV